MRWNLRRFSEKLPLLLTIEAGSEKKFMSDINRLGQEITIWQEKLFHADPGRKLRLERIRELLKKTSGAHCLEITSGDGTISRALRDLGGSWRTVATSEAGAFSVTVAVDEPVGTLQELPLPFEDQEFDLVVISDALEDIEEDGRFIQECHRVLKDTGWVLISSPRRRPLSCARLIRRLFGLVERDRFCRNGYPLADLLNILKDGFDVPEVESWSNGCFEAATALRDACCKPILPPPCWRVSGDIREADLHRYRKILPIYRFFQPLLAFTALFEFLPGHRLLLKSRRRPWRPRRQLKFERPLRSGGHCQH
jgi:SAM-dependent methyltransferase